MYIKRIFILMSHFEIHVTKKDKLRANMHKTMVPQIACSKNSKNE